MKSIYRQLQKEAIRVAEKYPPPAFYTDHADKVRQSQRFFNSDPMVCRGFEYVRNTIDDDYGHGLAHVKNVAIDAGALLLIEGGAISCSEPGLTHGLRMAHFAGLLHDICRKEENHAEAGAVFAEKVLPAYSFSDSDVADICRAIRNHEAFGENNTRDADRSGQLLSDCLYDADKFRWGPENFTQTIWGMVAYLDISVPQFLAHYPRGMAYLKKIRKTFRTRTGRLYGPQFIDFGIAIGNELYDIIRTAYADYPEPPSSA
ncbi:MAG: hypothetical protein ACQERN_05100 [Thermodesulfobacteriota bacterium]